MRRALAFLLVVLVVTAATASPASAATWGQDTGDCDELDEFLWVMSVGLFNGNCDSSELSSQVQELEQDQVNKTKTEVYNTGAQLEANTEQYMAVSNNYLQDSRTVAMSKAEAAAIEEIDANGSRSEVKTAAQQAVSDYYTRRQMNLIDHWNVQIQTIGTMENTTDVAGLGEDFVNPRPDSQPGSITDARLGTRDGSNNFQDTPFIDSETKTLANGSGYSSYRLSITVQFDSTSFHTPQWVSIDTGEMTYTSGDTYSTTGIGTDQISGQLTQPGVLNFTVFANHWSDIQSTNTAMESNAQEYAESLYNASQDGSVNASTYVSPSTLAQEYSTDYNSTGYYSYAVGYAATGGFAIPNLNETQLMTIQTGKGELNGLLMSQNPPNGSGSLWEVGKTYDASTIQGKQFVATTEGNVTELTGQFTISAMEDENGEAITNTSIQQFDYKTANTSAEYASLQEEIRILQQEIAEEDPSTGGGSGGSGGFGDLGLVGWGAIALVAVAAGAALLNGGAGGGGRTRRR